MRHGYYQCFECFKILCWYGRQGCRTDNSRWYVIDLLACNLLVAALFKSHQNSIPKLILQHDDVVQLDIICFLPYLLQCFFCVLLHVFLLLRNSQLSVIELKNSHWGNLTEFPPRSVHTIDMIKKAIQPQLQTVLYSIVLLVITFLW